MEKTSLQFFTDNPSEWFEKVIDIIPMGLYRTTLEGKLIFCNRFFAEIFGFISVRELIDFPVVNFYQDKKDRGNFIKTLLEKGYVEEFCIPLKKKQGTPIWCAVTAKVICDRDGSITFIDGVLRDVSKDCTEKSEGSYLLSENQETEIKFQGVIEMAGGVAHFVNQPLMIINNLIHEVLANLSTEDINYHKIVRISDQLKKLNKIAEKIRGIKTYETMDYVGGLKIVDIDKAALGTSKRKF